MILLIVSLLDVYLLRALKHLVVRQIKFRHCPDGKSECDFVLKKGKDILYLIQVCYELNEDIIQRELDGIDNCSRELDPKKRYIITNEETDLDTGDHEVIMLWRFLLHPERYLDL